MRVVKPIKGMVSDHEKLVIRMKRKTHTQAEG